MDVRFFNYLLNVVEAFAFFRLVLCFTREHCRIEDHTHRNKDGHTKLPECECIGTWQVLIVVLQLCSLVPRPFLAPVLIACSIKTEGKAWEKESRA